MSQELIYTSAQRGLKLGSQGFCTVQRTEGLAAQLIPRLEEISGYREAYPPNDPRAANNPVSFAHTVVKSAGVAHHVLSRICFAGLDYTGRTNKFAHHVVLEAGELPRGGPGWLLAQPGVMQATWDNDPRVLPGGRRIPCGDEPVSTYSSWKQTTGDAGWAGVLAETVGKHPQRPAFVLFEPGMNVLSLLREAVGLLPPEQRWTATFSTYFTSLPADVECHWRCVLADSQEAISAQRLPGALVLDLTSPLGSASGGRLVTLARHGQAVTNASVATPPALPASPIESRKLSSSGGALRQPLAPSLGETRSDSPEPPPVAGRPRKVSARSVFVATALLIAIGAAVAVPISFFEFKQEVDKQRDIRSWEAARSETEALGKAALDFRNWLSNARLQLTTLRDSSKNVGTAKLKRVMKDAAEGVGKRRMERRERFKQNIAAAEAAAVDLEGDNSFRARMASVSEGTLQSLDMAHERVAEFQELQRFASGLIDNVTKYDATGELREIDQLWARAATKCKVIQQRDAKLTAELAALNRLLDGATTLVDEWDAAVERAKKSNSLEAAQDGIDAARYQHALDSQTRQQVEMTATMLGKLIDTQQTDIDAATGLLDDIDAAFGSIESEYQILVSAIDSRLATVRQKMIDASEDEKKRELALKLRQKEFFDSVGSYVALPASGHKIARLNSKAVDVSDLSLDLKLHSFRDETGHAVFSLERTRGTAERSNDWQVSRIIHGRRHPVARLRAAGDGLQFAWGDVDQQYRGPLCYCKLQVSTTSKPQESKTVQLFKPAAVEPFRVNFKNAPIAEEGRANRRFQVPQAPSFVLKPTKLQQVEFRHRGQRPYLYGSKEEREWRSLVKQPRDLRPRIDCSVKKESPATDQGGAVAQESLIVSLVAFYPQFNNYIYRREGREGVHWRKIKREQRKLDMSDDLSVQGEHFLTHLTDIRREWESINVSLGFKLELHLNGVSSILLAHTTGEADAAIVAVMDLSADTSVD